MRRRRIGALLAVLLGALALMLCATAGAEPPQVDSAVHAARPPQVRAEAWALVDGRTGGVLAARAGDERLPSAAAVRLMRAYVALRGAPSGQAPGKVPVAELNRYAAALGLTNTHFAQPGGRGTGSYSSALDLAALTAELEKIRSFTKHTAELGVGRKDGVQLIAAVLGAPTNATRLADQRELLDWGFGQYPRRKTVRQGQVLATPSIRYAGGELSLRAARALTVGLLAGQTAAVEVDAPAKVTGPIRRGARLGTAAVVVDGLRAGSVALVAGRSVDAPGSFRKVRGWIGEHPVPLAVAVCAILIAAMLLGRQIRRIRKGKRVKQK